LSDGLLLYGLVQLVDTGLVGDYDGSEVLDAPDLDLQTDAILSELHPPAYDLNNDNLVDFNDRQVWVHVLKGTWIGDANLDGEFLSSDMVQVFVRGKYERAADAGWEDGDWNADGKFDSSDMVAAFADGGYEQGLRPAAAIDAVPEPSGVSLLLISAVPLLWRRRV
jgi:hypothetical protein